MYTYVCSHMIGCICVHSVADCHVYSTQFTLQEHLYTRYQVTSSQAWIAKPFTVTKSLTNIQIIMHVATEYK